MKKMLTVIAVLFYSLAHAQAQSTNTATSLAYLKSEIHPPVTVYTYRFQQELARDQALQDDATRQKNISKSFIANRDDALEVSNTFGLTKIVTWEKSEVRIDADIRSYADDIAEAQRLIDNLKIRAEKEGNQISFEVQVAGQNQTKRGKRNTTEKSKFT